MELIVAVVKIIAFSSLCFSTNAYTLDYADALEKSIIFFEAQRSGKLPADQRVTWRGNSGLSDGASYNVDLAGGYYDAGDNVKFGLPMAFTTTMLAWSVIEFGDLMHGQLQHAKAAIKWSTDYLIKAATATPDTLYVQVADPNMDHRCWERPEDMDTSRNVYRVTAQNPGSDVAAETAAALAAASIVFKDSDADYSAKLLQTAIKVFDFADRYRGSYSDSLSSVACPFYCSYSGYHDELLWGASWLHKASADASYMAYIHTNGQTLGAEDDDYSFSWDDKRAGAKILLSQGFLQNRIEDLQVYKAHADNYICSLVPGSPSFQAQYTPGGLLYKESESNLQYVTSATFLLLTYAKYLKGNGGATTCGSSTITAESLISLAKKQVDYILGVNPAKMSYMVGFGKRYPLHVHHRGSSIPSVHAHPSHISCNEGFSYLYSSSPNPNILTGAVLGGPDNKDSFSGDRNNYQQSEPATYINAPMVGALAFFASTPLAG
ncbi:LOW QUALITY PROTEIN: endoglucanase 1-like [Dioscorea cayenensis subsp. rotundata]|uniref:Endoglucanase n=1 Tax=Dioscorea cayennensis subsp. rotundata TaxID=55577 RepID=A0AB40B9Y4_DIOCR|nr:LOW QUALITY PROTEIN: endoglucanase 1-like [Dioscorea cayenensis subsp. rotundata]